MILRTAKRLVKRGIRVLGWDIQRLDYSTTEETTLKSILAATRPTAVLDVGANIGQFADLVRKAGYTGTIVSFEAQPSAHAELVERARRASGWIVAPCSALGSQSGELSINISANSVSSSLLPMRNIHLEAAPESVYVGKQAVRVERLDELCATLIPNRGDLMLKIDTQGYEKEVLQGATALLERVAALQVELSLVATYENSPILSEMVLFIESLGFEMFSIVPGFKDIRNGRVLHADGFFVRRR